MDSLDYINSQCPAAYDYKLYRDGMIVQYKRQTGRKREELIKEAQKERSYKIKRSQVRSTLINLWDERKKGNRVMFLTFTFAFFPDERQASKIWTTFLKNFKLQYDANNYVWVKERQRTGRIHYHIVTDIGRFNVQAVQNSFNSAVKNIDNSFPVSSNSFRLGSNPIVRSLGAVSRYLSKYIAKGEDNTFRQKAYGFTNDIAEFSRDIPIEELEVICNLFGKKPIYSDSFYSLWRINDYFDIKMMRQRFKTVP
jgi:hypothetical protein